MTPPVQAYRPENHQDFDRLYTETYRRVFATLVVGEVLRRLGRPRELSVNRVKIDRSFVNPDALRSR